MADQQRKQREKVDQGKIQELRENLGIVDEREKETDVEEGGPFSPEGLLDRNFGKNNEGVQHETGPKAPATIESSAVENASDEEKPLMQREVEVYEKLSNDPETSAYEFLYNRLDPKLSEEVKKEQMTKLMQEYKLYKEGKD